MMKEPFRILSILVLLLVSPLLIQAAGSDHARPSEQNREMAALEDRVRERINAIRRSHDLPALKSERTLDAVARGHSRRMIRENFFAHTDPSGDGVDDRLRSAGLSYRSVGENIYRSTNMQDPAESAVQWWMKSPGHRANILRKEYTHTGIGIWSEGASVYITQIFHRPR